MTATPQKRPSNREVNLRRKAKRQGLDVHRNRVRDVDAPGHGLFWLERDGTPVRGMRDVDLDAVERYLTRGRAA